MKLQRLSLAILIGFLLIGISRWAVSAETHSPPPADPTKTTATPRVLIFVAYNDFWWSEFKVAYEALRAQGYEIDVVSSSTGSAHSYGHNIVSSANDISSYDEFTAQFEQNFGSPWLDIWNEPRDIDLDGRIQDITDLSAYDALIVPGGTGMATYFYDGIYADAGPVDHLTTAAEAQSAAEQLNLLANEALSAGKPIGAECHGSNWPLFVRVPGSAGSGFDGLGISVLQGRTATAFNDDGFADLGVTHLSNEKIAIDGPNPADYNGIDARDLILTSVDWYPQTSNYFARSLINIMQSYPSAAQRTQTVNVLIFGGNEPDWYSDPQPARYDDLVPMLADGSDEFNFNVTATNNLADITAANLANYDVLFYFRHSTMAQSAQDAIESFVDDGGGLVGLHHAIWNPSFANGTIIDLFGGELPQGVSINNEMGLEYWGEENRLINVNMGEYVSTFGVNWMTEITETVNYTTPMGIPNANDDDDLGRGYYYITIPANDELYLGARFNPGVIFGRDINQINRLFSNDRFLAGSPNPNNGHYDTGGWTRAYDGNGDGTVGRIAFLQPGETMERTFSQPNYVQMVKNAVLWAALPHPDAVEPPPLPTETTIAITNDVILDNTKRLGINIGIHSQYGAGLILKNYITNPGFEDGHFSSVFNVATDAVTDRVPVNGWNTIWNNDALNVGQPEGFWDGAEYEILNGPAAGRSGHVTAFMHENDQYTFYLDGNGTAPTDGDILIVRRVMPGYNGDTDTRFIGDANTSRPGSSGSQSLRLTSPSNGWQSTWEFALDAHADGDVAAEKMLIFDGDWHFELWARAQQADETITLRIRRLGEITYVEQTFDLTTDWSSLTFDFNVPAGSDPLTGFPEGSSLIYVQLFTDQDGGDVWIDDIVLERANQTNPTVFSDNFVSKLLELNPGIIRDHSDQYGNSLEDELADRFGRGTHEFRPDERLARGHNYSLHEFLTLAQYLGTEPWYNLPPTWSPDEMLNFAAYLAAPAGSHPYADLRASLGQTAPWTDVFPTIHLEYSNEAWGPNNPLDPFYGASFYGGANLAQSAQNRYAILQSSPYYQAADFNIIIGGQASWAAQNWNIENNSNNHDTIALAPYFGTLEQWGSDEEIFYPLYAMARQDAQYYGRLGESYDFISSVGQGTQLGIYEINFHTTTGPAPESIRNDFVTGLAGGLALPLHMLTYQEQMGIREQAAFTASGFSFPVDANAPGNDGDDWVRVWGMLRDLEATGRKRPTWLGVELANRAIRGDMITTQNISGDPTLAQPLINGISAPIDLPLVQSYAFRDGSDYAVMIFNLQLTQTQTITLNIPDANKIPNPIAALHTLSAPSPYSNNEDAENVTIATTTLTDFGQDYQLVLEPHSAIVLEWGDFSPTAVALNTVASHGSPMQLVYALLPAFISTIWFISRRKKAIA